MHTGLTTIPEASIEKHLATAHSFITRIVVLEDPSRESVTALAGTNPRFVATVSIRSPRHTREGAQTCLLSWTRWRGPHREPGLGRSLGHAAGRGGAHAARAPQGDRRHARRRGPEDQAPRLCARRPGRTAGQKTPLRRHRSSP